MPLIQLPKHYHPDFTQPNVKPKGNVNLESDFKKDLKHSFIFQQDYTLDKVSPADRLTVAGTAPTFGNDLIEFGGAAGTNYLYTGIYSTPSGAGTPYDFTLTMRFSVTAPFATDKAMFELSDNKNNGTPAIYIRHDSADKISVLVDGGYRFTSTNSYSNEELVTVTLRGGADGWFQFFINGEYEEQYDGGVSWANTSASDRFRINSGFNGGSFRRRWEYLHYWERKLSVEEIRALHQDHYRTMYAPAIPMQYFVPAGAGGSTTAELTAGSFTLSGTDLGTDYNQRAAIDAGSFALSGIDIETDYNQRTALDAGSFAWSGVDIGTLYNRRTALAAGSFALSGIDIGALYNQQSQLDAGSFTISGTDITTLQQLRAALDSAGFVISGIDIETDYNQRTALDVGSFTISGTDITTTVDTLTPTASLDVGAFTISGIDIGTLYNQRTALDAGSFTWSGIDVDTSRALLSSIDAGVFVLTGTDIDEIYNQRAALEAGGFVITGASVTLTAPGAGAIQIVSGVQRINRTVSAVQRINQTIEGVQRLS